MLKIPKIIHQTWKTQDIPKGFRGMVASWREKHPDWQYRLWTDDMNRDFIKRSFPGFLQTYDAYPVNIQRVDAVRYFILRQFGGVYIDLDFECLSNIEPLIGNAQCLFGKEPPEHCLGHGKDFIISNAFMAAAPGHGFIATLCTDLHFGRTITDHCNNNILETTGPFMLSRKYQDYPRKDEIVLIEHSFLYPLTKDELLIFSQDRGTMLMREQLSKAFAIHHYTGTWWKKEFAQTNPQ